MKKKMVAFFAIVILVCLIASSSFAVDISVLNGYGWSNPAGEQTNTIGGNAIAIMQVIGVSIALIMLIGIAIKYMTSSPNDRAELKKHMVPYIFGAFFIFGAVTIISILKNLNVF